MRSSVLRRAAFSSFAGGKEGFFRGRCGVKSDRAGNAGPVLTVGLVKFTSGWTRPMKQTAKQKATALVLPLALLGGLLVSACTGTNNCTGNGWENPDYCTGTLHPNAGPYAGKTE